MFTHGLLPTVHAVQKTHN